MKNLSDKNMRRIFKLRKQGLSPLEIHKRTGLSLRQIESFLYPMSVIAGG